MIYKTLIGVVLSLPPIKYIISSVNIRIIIEIIIVITATVIIDFVNIWHAFSVFFSPRYLPVETAPPTITIMARPHIKLNTGYEILTAARDNSPA